MAARTYCLPSLAHDLPPSTLLDNQLCSWILVPLTGGDHRAEAKAKEQGLTGHERCWPTTRTRFLLPWARSRGRINSPPPPSGVQPLLERQVGWTVAAARRWSSVRRMLQIGVGRPRASNIHVGLPTGPRTMQCSAFGHSTLSGRAKRGARSPLARVPLRTREPK